MRRISDICHNFASVLRSFSGTVIACVNIWFWISMICHSVQNDVQTLRNPQKIAAISWLYSRRYHPDSGLQSSFWIRWTASEYFSPLERTIFLNENHILLLINGITISLLSPKSCLTFAVGNEVSGFPLFVRLGDIQTRVKPGVTASVSETSDQVTITLAYPLMRSFLH
jgi:hypothetical protein